MIGSATWTLVAQDPGRTRLTSGSAKAVDAINIFDAQYFAADLENEAVQRRLAEALADQITHPACDVLPQAGRRRADEAPAAARCGVPA